ncbi:hypothetical protein ASPZODRAFT_20311 [Penicilliopsis zonata CBS 506.65]|uniref:Peptidase M12A domain-containing protein n=1 Tax=Penicilliopsis zonata CBS 506.65 TaxID=1073090 RepID=A0A1L9S5Y7_9EURO|nr:hypothetical protein ASPZODRAFT_20311 [Penicilliopsis zonata CBS 506.65]OJJ42540.1 hypothetical protein ASPZODRAFT_20311 [Penicilliopsis zonata CBS 506.65]
MTIKSISMQSLYLFLALVWACDVLAGSRVWQPASSQALDRRFFYIQDKSSQSLLTLDDREVWPGREIRYCWDPSDPRGTKRQLKKNLKAAHNRWITKGLSSDFRLTEATSEVCQDSDARHDLLFISLVRQNEGMATSVGRPAMKLPLTVETSRCDPKMLLFRGEETGNIGVRDMVANYAHELGHAWGLYHEHQNPAFWSGTLLAQGGSVFGPGNNGNWRCENLKDYNSFRDRIVPASDGVGEMNIDNFCSSYTAALKVGFSAADYLPMDQSAGTAHSTQGGPGDVDWASVMIYPSGAGGVVDNNLPGDDKRSPILLKPDGTRIPENRWPSQMDITGLHQLYGQVPAAKKSILQKVGGATTRAFNKVYDLSKGRRQGEAGCL